MKNEVRLLDPAVNFILAQNVKMQAKIQRTLGLLEEFGHDLREPHVKKIHGIDGLYELRVKLATDICRLFYFHFKGKIFVVTSGYVKKEQKTNPREISRAYKLMLMVKEQDNE